MAPTNRRYIGHIEGLKSFAAVKDTENDHQDRTDKADQPGGGDQNGVDLSLEEKSDGHCKEDHISGDLLKRLKRRPFFRPSASFKRLSAVFDFMVGGEFESKEYAPDNARDDDGKTGFHGIRKFYNLIRVITRCEISVQLGGNRRAGTERKSGACDD